MKNTPQNGVFFIWRECIETLIYNNESILLYSINQFLIIHDKPDEASKASYCIPQ